MPLPEAIVTRDGKLLRPGGLFYTDRDAEVLELTAEFFVADPEQFGREGPPLVVTRAGTFARHDIWSDRAACTRALAGTCRMMAAYHRERAQLFERGLAATEAYLASQDAPPDLAEVHDAA